MTIRTTVFESHTCIDCSVVWGLPIGYTERRMGDKKSFFCPNGHSMAYTESEADRLRQERDRLKQRNAMLQDEAQAAQRRREEADRSASAYKGQVTRLKNRAMNGVCPCCNRSFKNLQRHMAGQHPNYTDEPVEAE